MANDVELSPEEQLTNALDMAFRTYENRVRNAIVGCSVEIYKVIENNVTDQLIYKWHRFEQKMIETKNEREIVDSQYIHKFGN